MNKCRGPLSLPLPQAKRRHPCQPGPGQPLPVPLASLTSLEASNDVWAVYHGTLVSHTHTGAGLPPEGRLHTVKVENREHIQALQTHGMFGLVVEGDWVDNARIVMEQWKPGEDSEDEEERGQEEEPESWGEIKEREEERLITSKTVLHLELCEAFFLSYGLGCLTVTDGLHLEAGDGLEVSHRDPWEQAREQLGRLHSPWKGARLGYGETRDSPGDKRESCLVSNGDQNRRDGQLGLLQMWDRFCNLEKDFPLRYRVYHHYRTEGWVLRSGYKFGCDWALYKKGPAFYHATYTVRVEGVDRVTGEVIHHTLNWRDILARTRVAATIKKELLLVRVSVWGDRRDWASPHCLGSMAVKSIRVRRWLPGEERWHLKPEVPVIHTQVDEPQSAKPGGRDVTANIELLRNGGEHMQNNGQISNVAQCDSIKETVIVLD